jgi:hypothetical protein
MGFFLPCEPLSILYRQKLRAALAEAEMLDQVAPEVWNQSWVVDCQTVGDGRSAVKYLAPYVFRVAISDQRIVACDDTHVTFRYRRSGSRRWRTMSLEAAEFVRRFLQHVLPRGLQKIRHYGFLSPNSRQSVEALQWLVAATLDLLYRLVWSVEIAAATQSAVLCPECGQAMLLIARLPSRPAPVPLGQPP